MNNQKKPEEVRDRFIGEIGRLGESIGLNRMTCQMYALLYLEEGALSLTELSRMLHISKGSASLNIRKLVEWGAVKPVWRKGSNQNYYQGNRDLFGVAKNRLKLGLTRRMELIEENVLELAASANPDKKSTSEELKILKKYRQRFREVLDFIGKIRQLQDLLG